MKAQLLAVSAAMILTACTGEGSNGGATAPQFAAEVTRTSYGVAHIRANDFAGVGYGLAYTFSEDNICMLADSFLTVRGERARYFGPDAHATMPVNGEYGAALDFIDLRNEDSDFFFKGYLDMDKLRAGYAAGSGEIRQLLRGYAAGYNRYLRDHGARLPQACQNAPWVKPISVDDVMLLIAEKALHATGEVFAAAIVAAAREADGGAALLAGPATALLSDARAAVPRQGGMASNALAIGKEASSNGRGILLGNPHYPWTSTDRFYQVHITVPGIYDAMGVSLGGLPLVVIGFNRDLAWTHTVTKAVHFTTFRLPRDAADPMRYAMDGATQQLETQVAVIDVLQPDGSLLQKRKAFYFSKLGAVLALPGDPQGPGALLVLGDPNRNNTRLMEQWLAMGRARSVQELKQQLERVIGLPWVNTVAADRAGGALYADASVVPHVGAEQFGGDCLLLAPLLMFDGARASCTWGRDGGAPDGIIGGANAPAMLRPDYVANSNDGYWLTNARQLLVGPAPLGYSPLYGPVGVAQHLRTRSGFIGIEDMLARHGRVGPDDVQAMLFANRVLAAELVLPDLLPACMAGTDVLLLKACTVLANWDRKADLESRGAVLFREFWNSAARLPDRWSTAFDPSDPVHSPRGVAPAVIPAMLAALKEAAQRLQALGVPFDGRLADYQVEPRNGQRFPIHGAIGDIDGSYNSIHMAGQLGASGYEGVTWGTSYIHLVSFDAAGPQARGLLVYGQSTDPRNAHYADQLPLYAAKRLPLLPFTADAIAADPARQVKWLREP
ncbi:penicillin acylase family protein [Pseudoduganella violaceinigra]|uniref:penicillin acylase family protein n=1 Tax=Pseudoduganella violaceinigra TaxID=246602 RepID=UPI001377EA16|nr:penicillin acylase family protein [Pseudoduganella violaceinigra]